MNRRDMLRHSGAAALTLGLGNFPLGWATADTNGPKKKILMFTRSQGFEHSVVKRSKGEEYSLAERIVQDLAKKHNFEVTCTKDGRVFLPETIAQYDAFLFETTEDLTKEGGDKHPPMPADGKKTLLDAISKGKGFVGCHCASDTFHSADRSWKNQDKNDKDPYIAMLGGEFYRHGPQQKARMHVVDDSFPATKGLKDFEIQEEWYALKNFAPDLHVLLVQETDGMRGAEYVRPNYPATWAHMFGEGRVFYTSLGHREDVWESERFHKILLGALAWATRQVDADVTPNLDKATPQSAVLPPQPAPGDNKNQNKKKKKAEKAVN